ncbi:MAG: MFS transporter, partial [Verrucomicrobia bacterium]|nr:MFS transporter [Verrucomicrobiota bacterium]
GIGSLVAASVCPQLFSSVTKDGVTNFQSLFLIPLGLAIVAAIALAIFFNPPAKAAAAGEPPKLPH